MEAEERGSLSGVEMRSTENATPPVSIVNRVLSACMSNGHQFSIQHNFTERS